jgi:hypothetical protein
MQMTREEVLKVLSEYRPELKERDWTNGDVITVLKWLLPAEKKKWQQELES